MAVKNFFHIRCQRGFALIDLLLAIGVSALVVASVLPYASYQISKARTQAEMRSVATLADVGLAFVQRDVAGSITDARASVNAQTKPFANLLQITRADLEAVGLAPDFSVDKTTAGRDMQLWIFAPDTNQIIVLARATGTLRRGSDIILEGTYETGKIGAMFADSNNLLRGPGVNWNVQTGFRDVTNATWPDTGDIIALRYADVRFSSDVYLHRSTAASGSRNVMEVDLIITGDLSVTGAIEAQSAELDNANFGTFQVNGATTLNTLTVNGATVMNSTLRVDGDTTLGATAVEGTLTARTIEGEGDLTIAGDLTANDIVTNDLSIAGNLSSATANIGILQANQITFGGVANISGLVVTNVNVTSQLTINGDMRIIGEVQVDQDLRVNRNLQISGICTGCSVPP